MFQHKKQAFTLVELIVVITILAILGTIAFISLSGYSKSSRDSVRVTDTNNIKTSLELFVLKTGKYPEPQNYKEVTYSGGLVWQEGVYGEETLKQTGIVSKDPKDPLEDVNYTYSRLNTTKEYELGIALERDQAQVINQVNAGDKLAISYITGNYNGLIAQVQTGSTTYVLAIPTIISTDPVVESIETLVSEKKLAYTGYKNLPSSYKDTSLNTEGEEDLVLTNNLVAYSGSELPSTGSGYTDLITNLQNSYSGTTISEEGLVERIVQADANDSNNNELLGKAILSGDVSAIVTQSNTEENTIPGVSCGVLEVYTASGCVTGEVVLSLKGDNELNVGLDSTGRHTPINNGAQYSTGTKLFGDGSMSFDGNNSYIEMSASNDWAFGTSDFTIMYWFKSGQDSAVTAWRLAEGNTHGGNWFYNYFRSSDTYARFGIDNSNRTSIQSTVNIYNDNNWHHVANVRKDNIHYFFVDGKLIGTDTMSFSIPYSDEKEHLPKIGGEYHSGTLYSDLNGNVDEYQIVSGIGLFDSEFNPYAYYCAQSEYASDPVCLNKCTSEGVWCDETGDISCKAVLDNNPGSIDGLYWIDPDGTGGIDPLKIECDMTTDGGGWTYIFGNQYNYGNFWNGIYCEQLPSTELGALANLEYQEAYITAAGQTSTRQNNYSTYTDQKFTLATKAAHLGNCNWNTTRNCQASQSYTCYYMSENIFDQNMLKYTSGDWQPLTVWYKTQVGGTFWGSGNYSYYFTYLKVR